MKRKFSRVMISAALAVLFAAALSACGGSSGGGALADWITGGGGGRVIDTSGGDGSDGDGGDGNYIEFYTYTSGDINILKSGGVNTAFTANSYKIDLGTNPLTVDANTTLTPGTTVGYAYGDDSFYGDDGATDATGVWIKPGFTLTVLPNNDTDNADGDATASTGTMERAYLYFGGNGINWYIQGKLVVGRKDSVAIGDGLTGDGADLYLYIQEGFVTAPGSTVDTRATRLRNESTGRRSAPRLMSSEG